METLYLEPMMPINQTRVMLYLSQRLSIYDNVPVDQRLWSFLIYLLKDNIPYTDEKLSDFDHISGCVITVVWKYFLIFGLADRENSILIDLLWALFQAASIAACWSALGFHPHWASWPLTNSSQALHSPASRIPLLSLSKPARMTRASTAAKPARVYLE